MNAPLAELKSDVDTLKARVDQLYNPLMFTVSNDIGNLHRDVIKIKEGVEELKTDVAGLKTDVAGLKQHAIRVDRNIRAIMTHLGVQVPEPAPQAEEAGES